MKKHILISIAFTFSVYCNAQLGLLNSAESGASNTANGDASQAGSDAVNSTVKGIFGSKKKEKKQDTAQASPQKSNSSSGSSGQSSTSGSSQQPAPNPTLKAYSNYDFVPGNDIVFDDNLSDGQDGEFPPHWKLNSGQGVENPVNGNHALMLTDGNYAIVEPRIKTKNYLSDTYTIEFDYYPQPGGQPMVVLFNIGDDAKHILIGVDGLVHTVYFDNDLNANYPGGGDNFAGQWHHVAIAIKNKQIKCYVDQYRILVIPDCGFTADKLTFGGIGSQDQPIVFTNVRIANGGNMNMLDKIMSDGKFMTHAITFDIDKASIKPESMGFINQLAQWLKTNSSVKLEVDGYTDNSGSDDHNKTLSQQRAESVKAQLVSMGIDASRLTTSGFGSSKPISSNDTPEGRSNNRRVEFVKT